MLSVVCFDLIPEAISPENAPGGNNLFLAAAGISLGCLVIYLLNDIIDQASVRGAGHANGGRLVPAAPDGLIRPRSLCYLFSSTCRPPTPGGEGPPQNAADGAVRSHARRGELLAAGAVMALAMPCTTFPKAW
jgi:hypothetical protein